MKEKNVLNYLIIGAGGCGGSIGAFMARAGKKVSFIARGAHRETMKRDGLSLETTRCGNFTINPADVFNEEEYLQALKIGAADLPDVIFVCVKFYSLQDIVPFLKAVSNEHTVIIPILNVFTAGQSLARWLPEPVVTDGCMYIAAEIKSPGCIVQKGDIFRVVFGVRKLEDERLVLKAVERDLKDSGIDSILSENIRYDALIKFSLISPMAACGAYYDVRIGQVQKPGEIRETFIRLVDEIGVLGRAMGLDMPADLVQRNLKLIDDLLPDACASMQRDLWQGKASEIDGIVYAVPEMAKNFGISLPVYEKVAKALKDRYSRAGEMSNK